MHLVDLHTPTSRRGLELNSGPPEAWRPDRPCTLQGSVLSLRHDGRLHGKVCFVLFYFFIYASQLLSSLPILVKCSKVNVYLYSALSKSASNVLPASRKSALISASQPYSQAFSEHCETTDTGWCITRYACLLPSLRRVFIPAWAGSG